MDYLRAYKVLSVTGVIETSEEGSMRVVNMIAPFPIDTPEEAAVEHLLYELASEHPREAVGWGGASLSVKDITKPVALSLMEVLARDSLAQEEEMGHEHPAAIMAGSVLMHWGFESGVITRSDIDDLYKGGMIQVGDEEE
jgi:hypothetical protein